MCLVSTSRVGFQGLGSLDITVKSATSLGRVLAPTWAMVGGVKGWGGYEVLSIEQYTQRYYDLLRERFRQNGQAFLDILAQEQTCILCYCRPNVFCHRHLAVDILERIAQRYAIPFVRGGEVSAT